MLFGFLLLFAFSSAQAQEGEPPETVPAVVKESEGIDGGILGKRPVAAARRTPGESPVSTGQAIKVLAALGAMVAALGAAAWWFKRSGSGIPGVSGRLVEVLSRTAVGPKQQVVLIRIGPRILLLGVTPDAIQNLAEIREGEEVERLSMRTEAPSSAPARFRGMLKGMVGNFRAAPVGEFEPEDEIQSRVRKEIDQLKQKLSDWEDREEKERPMGDPLEGGSVDGRLNR